MPKYDKIRTGRGWEELVVGYIYAILNYLKTEKARHDLVDYIRAAIIIAAVMAMVRIILDMLL
jgi:hypothetical protein